MADSIAAHGQVIAAVVDAADGDPVRAAECLEELSPQPVRSPTGASVPSPPLWPPPASAAAPTAASPPPLQPTGTPKLPKSTPAIKSPVSVGAAAGLTPAGGGRRRPSSLRRAGGRGLAKSAPFRLDPGRAAAGESDLGAEARTPHPSPPHPGPPCTPVPPPFQPAALLLPPSWNTAVYRSRARRGVRRGVRRLRPPATPASRCRDLQALIAESVSTAAEGAAAPGLSAVEIAAMDPEERV